jgi:oligoribonuclease (3'-5' exoribonuclease)
MKLNALQVSLMGSNKPMTRNLFLCDVETTGITKDDIPIEIAFLVVEPSELKLLDAFTTLIRWPDHILQKFLNEECMKEWNGHAKEAQKVHGIEVHELKAMAMPVDAVALKIKEMSIKYSVREGEKILKPVLVSDNIAFERNHTDKIVGDCNSHFHYCGWDTSFLFSYAQIADPDPAHRAMADVMLLYNQVKKVFNGRHLTWP